MFYIYAAAIRTILSPPPPRHEWKCISHTPGDIYGEPAAVQYISATLKGFPLISNIVAGKHYSSFPRFFVDVQHMYLLNSKSIY